MVSGAESAPEAEEAPGPDDADDIARTWSLLLERAHLSLDVADHAGTSPHERSRGRTGLGRLHHARRGGGMVVEEALLIRRRPGRIFTPARVE